MELQANLKRPKLGGIQRDPGGQLARRSLSHNPLSDLCRKLFA
jgi:hypothetical protein